jgi:hypothetical protein
MRNQKLGDTEPPSQEEIASIKNQYTKDTIQTPAVMRGFQSLRRCHSLFLQTFCEHESKSLGLDAQSRLLVRLSAVPAMPTALSGAGSGATADDAGRKVDKPVHTE